LISSRLYESVARYKNKADRVNNVSIFNAFVGPDMDPRFESRPNDISRR
jgi:hypothetical protein